MTKILAVGDLHGRLSMLESLINKNPDVDFVIQAGDFGIYCDDGTCCGIPPKRRKQSEFPSFLHGHKSFKKPVFFVKGNHEHFRWLDEASKNITNFESAKLTENLFYIPNGNVISFAGVTIAGLGGNYSSACYKKPRTGLRRRHFSEKEINNILTYNGKIDILLTHDIGEGMIPSFRGLSQELLVLGQKLHPTWWIHGHFHCYHEDDLGFTKVVGLDAIHGMEKSYKILEI